MDYEDAPLSSRPGNGLRRRVDCLLNGPEFYRSNAAVIVYGLRNRGPDTLTIAAVESVWTIGDGSSSSVRAHF